MQLYSTFVRLLANEPSFFSLKSNMLITTHWNCNVNITITAPRS